MRPPARRQDEHHRIPQARHAHTAAYYSDGANGKGELAKFSGVTRVTIGNAIRTLREEGFVRAKTGSGVYVRMPDAAAEGFQELTAEFESGQTTGAQAARDRELGASAQGRSRNLRS
jgi:DNA-binding transcriptional MocR family regulator